MLKKLKKIKKNRGMTYVELIVVLSIFAIMSGVVLFNYKEFQAKVDIRRYASDIALKIVEAQKSAMSGKQGMMAFTSPTGNPRPSYGVHFDLTTADKKKELIYFADYDNSKIFDGLACGGGSSSECIDKITITKGNFISNIEANGGSNANPNSLDITFTRPNSRATFYSGVNLNANYITITVAAPNNGPSASVRVYSSGRIQLV